MPATDFQGSSAAASFGRSILSLRRDTVDSQPSPPHVSSITELELEAFQKQVAERFSLLLCDDMLSLHWMHNLLKAYIACLDDFRFILFNNKSLVNKPPLDRLIHEFFERSVKALDVCNAVRDGIEQIRDSNKFVEIVRFALDNSVNKRFLSEGQFRRAKKALADLSITFFDDRESGSTPAAQRNRSFGRQCVSSKGQLGNFRSLSWSVSRSWSAARQLQAIGSNLVAPKGNEIVASNGIAVAVYTMGSVLLFVMWAMVAAIPCQDRGLQVHFSVPRQFVWAAAVQSLHEKIFEESKKRDRKNACGLLREIYQMGKCTKVLAELIDSVHFPLGEEKEAEIMQRVQELGHVCDSMKEGLDPLEKQVRQVFHKIINSRTEVLDSLGRVTHHD